MNDFSIKVKEQVSKLSRDKLVLFCNLNCEKILPAYRIFAAGQMLEDVFFDKTIEDVYFNLISSTYPDNYEKLVEELDSRFPNLDRFETPLASYAFDACTAFSGLFLYLTTNDKTNVLNNSQACINTVDMFIQQKENINYVPFKSMSELEKFIAADEFMLKENDRQLSLLNELNSISVIDKSSIESLRTINNKYGPIIDYSII